MPRSKPRHASFIGQRIPGNDDYVIEGLLHPGDNADVYVAASAKLRRKAACKIIPAGHLVGIATASPAWQDEVQRANDLKSDKVVKIFAVGQWTIGSDRYAYILADLVEGKSLKTYLQQTPIDMGFLTDFVEDALEFLLELKDANSRHGDLHAGNILVEHRRSALRGKPYRFRYTDFGVAPSAEAGRVLDDFEQLASLLRHLLGRLDFVRLTAPDRSLYNFVRDDLIPRLLLEKDATRNPLARDPKGIYGALKAAEQEAVKATVSLRKNLDTPFDFLSCEQLGEKHALLKDLYSDHMFGLPLIEGSNNLVLTGPRGCGKTTVFRCASLKHRVLTDDDDPQDIKYVGVYYRCDDLYFSFPRYKASKKPNIIDIPVHFFTVTLLKELIDSVCMWLPRKAQDSWSRGERACSGALWSLLKLPRHEGPGSDSLAAVARALEKERLRAAQAQRSAEEGQSPKGRFFGPDILSKACAILSSFFPELGSRPIYFLIDDYSAPKITPALQRNLNRLAMHRTSSYFFKLATESPASFSNSDIDEKPYVEGREYSMLNLGMKFIHADMADKLRFVDDIFERRFTATPTFPVRTLHGLIGGGPNMDNNKAAREIRANKKPSIGGRHALAELCSGDVHFLIDLVGKMVSDVGGVSQLPRSVPAISISVQNKAIRREAGTFLRNLRTLPSGTRLVDVVEAFGAVAASYLRHKDSKNEAGHPPHQASRIEPIESPDLPDEAREVYNELLRYSVFLEDPRGKSRRNKVVPRLYLRRFLIPHFKLTFSKRDSLELTVPDLAELLLSPKDFEKHKRLREPPGNSSLGDDEQLTLIRG